MRTTNRTKTGSDQQEAGELSPPVQAPAATPPGAWAGISTAREIPLFALSRAVFLSHEEREE